MKKIICFLLLIVFLGGYAFSQSKEENKTEEKPDFSGTWILDEEKTYSKSQDREDMDNYVLVIRHNDEELKLSHSYTYKNKKNLYTVVLFTDKRTESNVNENYTDASTLKSKTFWKKQKIIRDYQNNVMDSWSVYKISKQIYSLSKDGKTLTVNTEFQLTNANSVYSTEAVRQNGHSNPNYQLIFRKKE